MIVVMRSPRARLTLVLAIVALYVAPEQAVDARVIRIPEMVQHCGSPGTWSAAVACMRKRGTVRLAQQTGRARVYFIKYPTSESRADEAFLFVERGGRTRLAGLLRDFEDGRRILAFKSVTIARHTGYRIDVGQHNDESVSHEGTVLDGMLRMKSSIFCSGQGWRCTEVVTACEFLVQGRALFAFHGKLEIKPGSIRLVGDRSNAGQICQTAEDVFLDWPMPDDE